MNTLKNATLLAIDDEPINLMLLEDFLQPHCKQVFLATDIESAFVLVQQKHPDIILLDILLGGAIDGYEVCHRLKANPETSSIPVIFLSSLINAADKVKGFQVGGVDFISKPFHVEEVLARLENCHKLHSQLNQKITQLNQQQQEKIAHYQLSKRETDILRLYISGYTRTEIAAKICLSENTVKWYLKQLFCKLNVKNRTQAVGKANEMGLIDF